MSSSASSIVSGRKLKVFVAGPTGTTGRMVVREFLDRGHSVTGFSKNPQKWGQDENYTPISGSVLEDLPALIKVNRSFPSQ